MFHILLHDVLENQSDKIGELNILSDQERKKVLFDFNQTGYPLIYKTIPALFEETAIKFSQNTAVVDEERNITYAELRQNVKCIASAMKELLTENSKVIALSLKPGIQMIQTILGVLYAGGIYVPIPSNCPEERRSFILEDSKALCLITDQESKTDNFRSYFAEELLHRGKEICAISGVMESPECKLSDPAYIIYTSGTTGRPKGVLA